MTRGEIPITSLLRMSFSLLRDGNEVIAAVHQESKHARFFLACRTAREFYAQQQRLWPSILLSLSLEQAAKGSVIDTRD